MAQPQLVPPAEPQRVFSGQNRAVSLLWRNAADKIQTADIRFRLYQTSSATALPVAEARWKELQVLPGQTILESARVDFPQVKAEAHFVIQWADSANRILGKTEVEAYPPGLLKVLSTLGAATSPPASLTPGGSLGVCDPHDLLKPVLKVAAVPFVDFADSSFAGFRGQFAIVGPFSSATNMPGDLAGRIKALAGRGIAVVWLLPPQAPGEPLQPSFWIIPGEKAAIVAAQSSLVANLAEDPVAQLNLIRLARLALHPELPQFAQISSATSP
jgi:hypothetical protein